MARSIVVRWLALGVVVLMLAACTSSPPPPAATAAPPAATAAKPAAPAAQPAATTAPAKPAPASGAAPATDSAAWQTILDAGKKEGRVTMYGTLLGGDEATRLAAAFKADTGIDFDFIALLGGPATTRIREEIKANKAPDIFEASGGWVVGMAPENVFTPLKDTPLPIWSEPDSVWFTHPGYKAPDDWQYVLSRLRPRGGHILVNTKLLEPADYPKSWHELATDPKYKGKLAYMDPTATSGLSTEIAMQQYVAKSMTAGDVWGMMASQDTMLFKQARANQTSVAQGERAVTWPGGDESILNLVAAGAPIKNLYFPETTYYAMTADMGVLKAAQHPNAAIVFINWYLSKQGQEAMGKIQQQSSIRRDVPNYFAEALRGEVVGGGKKGQLIVETPLQSKLATDVQTSGVLKLLVDGSSKDAYESAWDAFIKDWESKNGGAQDNAIVLQQ